MSSCGPLASSGDSASRMLKESWSWLTVLESERDWSSPSVWELVPECSSYSTTRSVSLSVMMQQPNTFSAHMRMTLITSLDMRGNLSIIGLTTWSSEMGSEMTNCAFTACSVCGLKWKKNKRGKNYTQPKATDCSPSSEGGSASERSSSLSFLPASPCSESYGDKAHKAQSEGFQRALKALGGTHGWPPCMVH